MGGIIKMRYIPIFILAALLGVGSQATAFANLLSDPGFKLGTAGYEIKDGPWLWSGGSNGASFYTSGEARTGTKSAKAVIWGGTATDYAFFNEDFTSLDFNLYTLSGYFLWDSASEPLRDGCAVKLQVKWLDSSDNVLLVNESNAFDNSYPADRWYFITLTTSAPPAGAVRASVAILLATTANYTANSAVYIDDMIFEVSKANSLLNSGFEELGWPPANWSQWDNSIAGYITTTTAHTGLQSVARKFYGSGDRWGRYTQQVAARAGSPVTASGWLMSNSQDNPLDEGAQAYLKLELLDASDNQLAVYTTDPLTSANDKWDYYEIVVAQAPVGTVKAKFSFVLTGSTLSTGKVYFDDAAINSDILTNEIINSTGHNQIESGLLTSYYKYFYDQNRFIRYIDEMPDYDQLTHYKVDMVSWINFDNPTTTDIMYSGVSDHFGAKLEGYIYIPQNDTYTFYIDSDDTNVSAVYISNMTTPMLIKSLSENITSSNIALTAGLHPIRLDLFHNYWSNKLILQWSSSSIAKTVIPSGYLFHAPAVADVRISTVDTDGDKLTDSDEINIYGTDPTKTDTDNDGLSDSDEINKYGTNALSSDTDSDGISDYIEAMTLFSLEDDPLGATTTVQTGYGADTSARLGKWAATVNNEIYSVNFRGALEYNISLPNDDMYCLKIYAKDHYYYTFPNKFELDLYVDNHYVATNYIEADNSQYKEMMSMLPYLPSGQHTIRLVWDNGLYVKSLDIASIKVESINGADSDSDGIKDWVEARLSHMCTVNNITSSKTSPVCLEGIACYPDLITLNTSTVVNPGPGYSWYGNIPLDPDQSTNVAVSFQNNGLTITRSIMWAATNIFEESPNLLVRAGDSLLLNPYPTGVSNGLAQLNIEGTVYSVTLGEPLAYEFSEPGEYTVIATYTDTQSQTTSVVIEVKAVALDLPAYTVACLVGSERRLNLPLLPEGVVLKSDPRLIAFYATGQTNEATARYAISIDGNKQQRYVVARLGENGPIISSMALQGVQVYGASQTWIYMAGTLEDDSEVIKMGNVLTPLMSGVVAHVELFLPGVIFDDAATEKILAYTDYDELSEAKMTMIKTPSAPKTSACHHIDLYQNGEFIGRAH